LPCHERAGLTQVALTYFQLVVEDYRWWWRSIFSGGSTGLFILMCAPSLPPKAGGARLRGAARIAR
jgi:hypothetical protein